MSQERWSELASFTQDSCGECHAIAPPELSPNPNAPPFASIVNQPGLTEETLARWLRDAHNYPQEMEFEVGEEQVGQLLAYMLTLRDEDFEPPIF